MVVLQTGSSKYGAGGALNLVVGNGGGMSDGGKGPFQYSFFGTQTLVNRYISSLLFLINHFLYSVSTGDMSLNAGQTSAQGRKGGSVEIKGGEGSSSHTIDGGDGGNIVLEGGEAKGQSENDNGGSITIRGGTSYTGYGGSLELISGQSTKISSGDICKHFCLETYMSCLC